MLDAGSRSSEEFVRLDSDGCLGQGA